MSKRDDLHESHVRKTGSPDRADRSVGRKDPDQIPSL